MPAPVTRVVDLGPALRRGDNTIEVEVATPFINRLGVEQPSVRPVPYVQAAVC